MIKSEILQKLQEKAKTKKSGVFSYSGIIYRVKDNRVTHIASNNRIAEIFGNFLVETGSYVRKDDAMKLLRSYNE